MKIHFIVGLLAILVFLTAEGCQKETVQIPAQTIPAEQAAEKQSAEQTIGQTTSGEALKGADMRILGGGFDPETIEVSAGGTVIFKNTDNNVHLVVVVDGERSPTLQPGDTWDLTLKEPGEYKIVDAIFKFSATVIVK